MSDFVKVGAVFLRKSMVVWFYDVKETHGTYGDAQHIRVNIGGDKPLKIYNTSLAEFISVLTGEKFEESILNTEVVGRQNALEVKIAKMSETIDWMTSTEDQLRLSMAELEAKVESLSKPQEPAPKKSFWGANMYKTKA